MPKEEVNELNSAEFEELKKLWLIEGFTQKEIAEWFGINEDNVMKYVRRIKISNEEFEEKEAIFAEIFNNSKQSKSVLRRIEKSQRRLRKAYANS